MRRAAYAALPRTWATNVAKSGTRRHQLHATWALYVWARR